MVIDGLRQGLGDAAVGHDGDREFAVVNPEPPALQLHQRHAMARLRQQPRVVGRVDGDQCQRADLRQQSTGEQFVR